MKNKSVYPYFLPFLFLLMVFAPTVNQLTGMWTFERKDENRAFTDSINFELAKLDKLPDNINNYIDDNFSFRRPLLDFHHYVKFNWFKVSPNPEKTMVGSNGWFFRVNKVVDLYEGRTNFTEDDLAYLLSIWKERMTYFDSLNIQPYWMIAPLKHRIYSEHLPFNVVESETKRIVQIKNYFDNDFPELIIDPTGIFLEKKDSFKLFYKQDNHWNHRAGQLTTELLLNRVKADFPEHNIPLVKIKEWETTEAHTGIHYSVIGIESLSEQRSHPIIEKEYSSKIKNYGFPPIKGFAYPSEYEKRYKRKDDKADLRILVIRDSFGDLMIPFLKESFKECVLIFDAWQYGLNKEIIETVKPDIILYLSVEYNIEHILREHKKEMPS